MKSKEFPGFIELIRESWKVYTKNLSLFLKLVAFGIVASVAFIVIGVVITAVLFGLKLFTPLALTAIIFIAAVAGVQIWVQLSLILSVKLILKGENVGSIKSLFKQARPLILPMIAVSLISAFLIFGGYILFIIPGVLFSVWFGFSTFILVDTGKRGMEALLASHDYIKGFVVKVFVRWILFGVLTGVVSWLPPFIFKELNIPWPDTLYSVVVSFALAPLTIIYGYLLYKALKAKKPKLTSDLSRNRKLKYVGVAAVGYLIALAFAVFLARTFANFF